MNKQIEEMAKVMQKCYEKNGLLNFKWFAEELIKLGYQKVNKNKEIVLSREEYDNLKLEIQKAHNKGVRVGFDLTKFKENSIEQARKETIREVFQRLFEEHNVFNENDVIVVWQVKEVLTKIAKQYGVEIKERYPEKFDNGEPIYANDFGQEIIYNILTENEK